MQATAPGPNGDDFVRGWYQIGGRWIVGGLSCYHCGTLWRNWHTGDELQADDIDPTRCVNLERPEARFVPCPGPDVIATEGGFTLRQHNRYVDGPIHPLVLKHARRSIRLSQCAAGCSYGSISRGHVIWVEGATVRGYVIASRKRVIWRLPTPVQIGLMVQITRLGRDAVATVFESNAATAPVAATEAYRLRWPR